MCKCGGNCKNCVEVEVKFLDGLAKLPQYSSDGAACFDLFSTTGETVGANSSAVFHTGLSFAIPENWVMKIYSRSGHGFKNGVRLANTTGVIDSDYRGEVMVKLHNDSNTPFIVDAGDRIAQGMLEKVTPVLFTQVHELNKTTRNEAGFGSTGN